jgi:hypothetical protein
MSLGSETLVCSRQLTLCHPIQGTGVISGNTQGNNGQIWILSDNDGMERETQNNQN